MYPGEEVERKNSKSSYALVGPENIQIVTDKHEGAYICVSVESCTAAQFECYFAHPVVECLIQTVVATGMLLVKLI